MIVHFKPLENVVSGMYVCLRDMVDLSVRLDILLPEIVVSGTVCFQDSREFFVQI